ncbi:MAG: type VI secretion system-associated FHA domain protein TagH [Burkholderiaceae bacterium]|nr:type VI secretion system-associated FHA domain protein TagH [Burkholderiaceae bacterium]
MIKLTAVSYNNQASPAPLSAVFNRDGGTLGRSEDNYFVLPDPKNLISRVQASVKSDGTHHTITNLSQANPILVNGAEIDFNREVPFHAGDEIQIGLYVLRAEPHLSAIDSEAASDKQTNLHTQTVGLRAVPPAAAAKPAVPNLAELHKKRGEDGMPAAPAHGDQGTADETADVDALMHAFLKGAGVPGISLNSGLTSDFMETVGKLLSTSIHGVFQLLAARSTVKREARADVTMVVVRNNNPLKFLSDSETVLIQMLRKKMPGFMGPNEALHEAFDDLQAHQSGMTAGMNGAFGEMLKRIDPKAIEKDLKGSLFDNLVPGRRKARLWAAYERVFEEIGRDAHDHQKLFGKAFVRAYERETERLQDAQHERQPRH